MSMYMPFVIHIRFHLVFMSFNYIIRLHFDMVLQLQLPIPL